MAFSIKILLLCTIVLQLLAIHVDANEQSISVSRERHLKSKGKGGTKSPKYYYSKSPKSKGKGKGKGKGSSQTVSPSEDYYYYYTISPSLDGYTKSPKKSKGKGKGKGGKSSKKSTGKGKGGKGKGKGKSSNTILPDVLSFSPSPSPSPYLTDNRDFTFKKEPGGPNKKVKCKWLNVKDVENRKTEQCEKKSVKKNCAKSCKGYGTELDDDDDDDGGWSTSSFDDDDDGVFVDADTADFTFKKWNGREVSCNFLKHGQSEKRKAKFCKKPDVKDKCAKSCKDYEAETTTTSRGGISALTDQSYAPSRTMISFWSYGVAMTAFYFIGELI